MLKEVTGLEEGVTAFRPGRACAAGVVCGLAVVLALLPALAALGLTPAVDGPFAARLAACLTAVVGGAKLAAGAWGLAARFASRTEMRAAAASID